MDETRDDYDNRFAKEYFSCEEKYSRVRSDGTDNTDIILANDPKDCITVRSGDLVKIRAITAENDFYVQPAGDDVMEQYWDMLQLVADHRLNKRRMPVSDNMFQVGLIVAVKNPEDRNHHRARILKNDGDSCYVLLVDTGNVMYVPCCRMTLLPAKVRQPPYFAVAVRLKNLSRTPLTTTASRYLVEVKKKGTLFRIEYENEDKNCVELVNIWKERTTLLSKVLKSYNVPAWHRGLTVNAKSYAISKYNALEREITYEQWPINTEIDVTVLNIGHGEILATKNGFNEVDLYKNAFNAYCSMNPYPYVPDEGEMCFVQYDGDFYRALCLKRTIGDFIAVTLIDYGILYKASFTNIRNMPDEFVEVKIAACYCKVVNDFDLSGLVNEVITCKVLAQDDPEYQIEILERLKV